MYIFTYITYMCVHIYRCMHTCTQIKIPLHMNSHWSARLRRYMAICLRDIYIYNPVNITIYMHMYIYVCMCIYIYTNVNLFTWYIYITLYIWQYICIYIYVCVYTYIKTYTYGHKYRHVFMYAICINIF